jgi:putative PIN family toxin of toxin-antitoxin system
MPDRDRFVADTGVLVSRLFFRRSVPAQAIRLAMSTDQLIVSSETVLELEDVLCRPKFDRYLSFHDRLLFLHALTRAAVIIRNVAPVTACRDPKDDKFLALALAGSAKTILTGDNDLLALHPFRGIDILNPRQYLDRHLHPSI